MAGTKYTASMRGGGPWGFRLQGGKDFGTPLAISKITPGSKADLASIGPGDYILEINGDSTANMTHFDAQDAVRRAGQNLDILLERKEGTRSVTVTETVHSAKSDYKFNAKPKPFGVAAAPPQLPQPQTAGAGHTSPAGGTTWQPPTIHAQHAPVAHTPPPAPPPAPPAVTQSRPTYDHSDADLAHHFKLNISDDGDVGFPDEPPAWGHPPDPKVQSKSFKRLQRHLDEHEEDDLPPPPPEAFDDPDDNERQNIQSRTFKMLQNAVDQGESPSSVFDRQKADRNKPSNQPLPKMYRPAPPVIKSSPSMPVAPPAPVMARPGQPQPVALPGMVRMSQPAASPPKRSPSQKMPTSASPAAVSPTSRSPPGQLEVKRAPTKPPSSQAVEETRTPFCDACGEEVFGPFVSAIGKAWHPEHFVCDGCGESLQNQGFIEEGGKLYCEKDFNKYFAPHCETCKQPISGPKSLHACPPVVPPPSSAMLRAIRNSSVTSSESDETLARPKTRNRLNSALTLKREPQGNHVDEIDNAQNPRTDYKKTRSWPRSSGVSNVTGTKAMETRGDPGVGSIRDKVVALKEALREANEREAAAKQAKPDVDKRFQVAKMLISKLERKRLITEDKFAKLEETIQRQKNKLSTKHRTAKENWQRNFKIEEKTSEEYRNIKNIEYEMSELKAAREAYMKRVNEMSGRIFVVQSTLQIAQDRYRELGARKRTLQDMLEMYNKRMNDLTNLSRGKTARIENKSMRKSLLEEHIADSLDRYKRAERRLLPLKIYIGQLRDSLEDARNETKHARYILSNFKQRLGGRKYAYYPHDK